MQRFFIVLLSLLLGTSTFAADRYWVATSASDWNNTANWSTTSGGAGGASVPGTSDIAIFDGSSTGTANITAFANILGLDLQSSYSGTIVQQPGVNFTVQSTGMSLNGGTFTGGDGTILCSGNCVIDGTSFTSTTGIFEVRNGIELLSGSFNNNNGTLRFQTSGVMTGIVVANHVEFGRPSSNSTQTITFSAGAELHVNGNLTAYNGNTIYTGLVKARGKVDNSLVTSGASPTGTLELDGTLDQTLAGHVNVGEGLFGNIIINKPSGTLFLENKVNVVRDWTYQQGTIDQTTLSSELIFIGINQTVTGTHTLTQATFNGDGAAYAVTIATGTILTIDGTLTVNNGTTRIQNGEVVALGDIDYSGTTADIAGTGTLRIEGTGNQTLTGSLAATPGSLPNVSINKPSGTLTLVNVIPISGDFTYVAGTIDAGTSTVRFNTNNTISGSLTLNNLEFIANSNRTFNIATGTVLTANSVLIDGTGNLSLNTGRIVLSGQLNLGNSGTLSGGSATIELNGTTDQTITSTSTEAILPANLVVNKASGSVLLSGNLLIQNNLDLTNGKIITSSGNQVVFEDAATSSGGNTTSYIEGPAQKLGGGSFSFPLGKGGQYRPLLAAGGNVGDVITAEYFNTNQTLGTNTVSGITISNCEHWTLTRTLPTTPIIVGLSWGAGSCNITPDLNDMRVAGWDGTQWEDYGNGGTTGDVNTGNVSSSITIPTYTAFTLGNVAVVDPNTTSWIGATNDDFFNPANWTNGKPSGTLNVVIGDGNYVGPFQPALDKKNATVKTLRVGTGGATISFDLGSKTLKVKGDIFLGPNGTLIADNAIKLEGCWINTGGTFDEGTSKVIFEQAVSPQVITAETFYNLHLKGNGPDISLSGDITALNELKIIAGPFKAGNHTITVEGRWFDVPQGFVAESSTVVFTAAVGSTPSKKLNTETYYNLVINSPSNTLQNEVDAVITVNGNFTVEAGTFTHDTGTGVVDGNGPENTITVKNGATLEVLTTNFADKYANFDETVFEPTSTTLFGGSVAQNIEAFNYGNLSLDGGSIKTTLGEINVQGDLTNLGAATNDLNLLTGSTFRIFGDLNIAAATVTADGGLFRLDGDWNSGLFNAVNSPLVGFAGSSLQTINQAGLVLPLVSLNNSGDGLQLNTSLTITEDMRFLDGFVTSTNTNILIFSDNATVSDVSDMSFVNGPVQKDGDDAFTFPTGAVVTQGGEGFYSPVRITAPSAVGSSLVAEYKFEEQAFGTALGTGLESISDCDYWTLESLTNVEDLEVQVWWENQVCPIADPLNTNLATWNGLSWEIQPTVFVGFSAGGSPGTVRSGQLSLAPTIAVPFALGEGKPIDQAYADLKKKLDGGYYIVNDGLLRLKYFEEYNDLDGDLSYKIYNSQHQILVDNADQSVVIEYGDNWRTLDFSCNGDGLNSGFYILEVTNEKLEKFFLRFYQKTNFVCGAESDK